MKKVNENCGKMCCNIQFSDDLELFKHQHTLFHHKNLERMRTTRKSPVKFHNCEACDMRDMLLADFMQHIGTRTHKDALNIAISKKALPTSTETRLDRNKNSQDSDSDATSTTTEVTSSITSVIPNPDNLFLHPSDRQIRYKRRTSNSDQHQEKHFHHVAAPSSSSCAHKSRDDRSISSSTKKKETSNHVSNEKRLDREKESDVRSRSSTRSRRYENEDSIDKASTSIKQHSSSSDIGKLRDDRPMPSENMIYTDSQFDDQQDKYRTERILQQCQDTVNQYRAQRVAMQAKHQQPFFHPSYRHPHKNMDHWSLSHPTPKLDLSRYPPPDFTFPPPGYPPNLNVPPPGYFFPPPNVEDTSNGLPPLLSSTDISPSQPASPPLPVSSHPDLSSQARRVAPLSTGAVQRIKMGESAVGKWLQESGKVDNSVASDMQVQRLLSNLLSRPRPSRSISTSSQDKAPSSTTAPSSASSVTDNAATVISPSCPVPTSHTPLLSEKDKEDSAENANVTHSSELSLPVASLQASHMLNRGIMTIKAEPLVEGEGDIDEACTNVTSLPTTERRAIMDMVIEPDMTARSTGTSMPSPQAKKIRLESSHQSLQETLSQVSKTEMMVIQSDIPNIDSGQDSEVAALLRAIELKREENRVSKALEMQLALIAEFETRLQEARETANKLREERRYIREMKARLCTEVSMKQFSDDEGNEADGGPPNSVHSDELSTTRSSTSHKSAVKRAETPLSSRSVSSQNARSANNTPVPPLTFVSHVATSFEAEGDGEVSSTPTSSRTYSRSSTARDLNTVIPALGNETVREIIQRVMAADEIEGMEQNVANSGRCESNQSKDMMFNNSNWADYQLPKREGTLSNVSSIPDCHFSDVDTTPRDGNSVVSDVLSLEPFMLQNSMLQLPGQQLLVKKELLSPEKTTGGNLSQSIDCVNASINQDKFMADQFFPGEISAHYGSAILGLYIHEDHAYTCAQNGTIKKFNLKTHQLIVTFHGHEDAVSCLSVTNKPKTIERVFTGGHDKRLLVFGGKSGRELQRLHFDDKILCLTMGWDWAYLGLSNGEVIQFNVYKNRVTNRWSTSLQDDAVGPGVSSLLCGKEGARQVLFVGNENGRVTMRDADNGLILQAFNGHPMVEGLVHSLAILGHRLFSASNKSLWIHDFTNAASLLSWKLTEEITSMSTSPQYAVLTFKDGAMKVYEIQANMPKRGNILTLYGRKRVTVTCIRLIENVIIAGTKEGDLLIMRISDSNFRCKFGVCEENYCSRDDLIYHIVRDHVVNCTNCAGQSIVCGWPQCSFVFHNKLGIKVIEEHVASHIN